ncbi:hypothetical protein D0T53_07575 [Dysgonomonas sp. 216]|uniref:fimbrillin family protein n=1 Tax=Dysgonomonas sp. 216 TaxID=2302934 RepID=UPI0013D3BCC2|nr:fimbrillin family protein [Dysgonomonas sp. 216]NDW18772.1 hypothetical protein [Dysgonomonas sp. 216]
MMKTYRIITPLVFFLLVFTSCSEETEEYSHIGKTQGRAVSFRPEDTSQLKSMGHIRDWAFLPGDRIGVFAVDMRNLDGNQRPTDLYAVNKCFMYDGQNFNPEREEDRLFVLNQKLAFYAYYPYNPSMDHSWLRLDFSVCPFQDGWEHSPHESLGESWHHLGSDLIVAVNEEGITGDIIPLRFRHMMAMVEVELNHGIDRTADSIILSRKYLNCTVDMMYSKAYISDTLKYDVRMSLISGYDGTSWYRALIPEQEVQQDSLLLRIYAGGKEYLHYADDYFGFKSGVTHNFRFSLPCTITLSHTSGGTVSGGGTRHCGDYVTVKAEMDKGYNFSGWYEDDKKVSGYLHYSFMANGDRTLEARFYPLNK